MAESAKKSKPGPSPERLKIKIDPEEALRRLLTKRPPEADEEPQDGGEEPEEGPERRIGPCDVATSCGARVT